MSKITYGRTCEWCAEYFTAERDHARFCSDTHRVAWHRERAQLESRSTRTLTVSAPSYVGSPDQLVRALVDADRSARSARSKPQPSPKRVSRGDYAEMKRVLGMDDPQRSEDLLAAGRSRQRADQEEARRKVEGLASALRKAKRAEQLAFGDWKSRPTSEGLAEVESAMRGVALLEVQLAEACQNDPALITEAKRSAGR
jgi:hypothetical protein